MTRQMQDSSLPDEFDLELINALQLAPRATWSQLAAVLEADATTLSRRWRRLTKDGIARVIVYPRQGAWSEPPMSYVELMCRNGTVRHVAAALAEDPGTLSIQFAAGSHQLMLTVSEAWGLSGYLLDWIANFPDVIAYRTHVVTGVPFEASRWELRALSSNQRRRLRELRPIAPKPATPTRLGDVDHALIAALSSDGRATYSELADVTGVSATTAQRRLNILQRNGVIGLRCDVARAELGWPVSAMLWGSSDAKVLERVAPDIGERVPELRFCSTMAGPDNTHLVLWLRSITDLQRVEHKIVDELPGLRIGDRRVVLRTMKLMGQVLDHTGRHDHTVPLRLGP